MSEQRWLFYMAPLENAALILHLGVYSYNRVNDSPELCGGRHSIADPFVNGRRHRLVINERSLHDYVPLYWATHTPMQYVVTQKEKRLEQQKLVFFLFDPSKIFAISGVLSTDGNAACEETLFYEGRGAEPYLDWKILETKDCYWPNYKRKKCAEVLVPDCIPPSLISKVALRSKAAREVFRSHATRAAQTLHLQKTSRVPIEVCPDFYYPDPIDLSKFNLRWGKTETDQ